MPTMETTTIRCTPASRPRSCRFRAAVVKNSVAAASSGEGPVVRSTMPSAPSSASASPSPVITSTPFERAIGTTSCPRASRISATCRPARPVAPATAMLISSSFVGYPSHTALTDHGREM